MLKNGVALATERLGGRYVILPSGVEVEKLSVASIMNLGKDAKMTPKEYLKNYHYAEYEEIVKREIEKRKRGFTSEEAKQREIYLATNRLMDKDLDSIGKIVEESKRLISNQFESEHHKRNVERTAYAITARPNIIRLRDNVVQNTEKFNISLNGKPLLDENDYAFEGKGNMKGAEIKKIIRDRMVDSARGEGEFWSIPTTRVTLPDGSGMVANHFQLGDGNTYTFSAKLEYPEMADIMASLSHDGTNEDSMYRKVLGNREVMQITRDLNVIPPNKRVGDRRYVPYKIDNEDWVFEEMGGHYLAWDPDTFHESKSDPKVLEKAVSFPSVYDALNTIKNAKRAEYLRNQGIAEEDIQFVDMVGRDQKPLFPQDNFRVRKRTETRKSRNTQRR